MCFTLKKGAQLFQVAQTLLSNNQDEDELKAGYRVK